MIDRLIRNCDVLIFKQGIPEIVINQDIAVEESYIKEIAAAGSIQTDEETKIINAEGLLAIPGLINTHAHVPMVLMRNLAEDVTVGSWFNDYIWPMESNLTAEDVYWGAQLGIAEMIENGITCVADHYFFMDEVAKAVEQSGMRANLSWAVFGHEGEKKLDETLAFVNRWQGAADGRITTWLGPHSPYTCEPDFLALTANKAKKNNLGIHIHVSETEAQVKLALKQYGKTPVQICKDAGIMDVPTIFAHCKFPRPVDFDLMVKAGTGVAQAPKTYLKHAMTIAPIETFLEKGIPFGLATDGVVSNNTMDILEQMGLLGMLAKLKMNDSTFLPVEQLINIAFKGGAKVLRMDKEIGELKVGMKADIALLKQDGLHMTPHTNVLSMIPYNARGSDVDTVLCNGQVLMKNRKLLTLDKDRIRVEVQSRVDRLSKRTPNSRIADYPI
ncbi:MAG: amidohydrolase [Anaerolineaceae bacterium]|nr:amidohydrolase [Anaerolineaceae bacterium]